MLLAAGFRTLEAATGAEAVALADEHLPDVVLMDIRLPDMDGTDAARMLAEQARTAAIPVVALTSLTLEDDTDWLRTAGFAGYLEKPIDVESFRTRCAATAAETADTVLAPASKSGAGTADTDRLRCHARGSTSSSIECERSTTNRGETGWNSIERLPSESGQPPYSWWRYSRVRPRRLPARKPRAAATSSSRRNARGS